MNQETENSVSDSKSESANAVTSIETEKKKSSQDVIVEKNGVANLHLEEKSTAINESSKGENGVENEETTIEKCDKNVNHSEKASNHTDSHSISEVSNNNVNNENASKCDNLNENSKTTETALEKDQSIVDEHKNSSDKSLNASNGSPTDLDSGEPMDIDIANKVADTKDSVMDFNSDEPMDIDVPNKVTDTKDKSPAHVSQSEEKGVNSSATETDSGKNKENLHLQETNASASQDSVPSTEKPANAPSEVIAADNGTSDVVAEKCSTETATEKKDLDKNDTLTTKTEKKSVEKSKETKGDGSKETGKKKKSKTCEECGVKKGLKFQVLFQGKTRFLCSDTCFKNFKTKQKKPAEAAKPPELKCAHCEKVIEDNLGYYPVIGEIKPLCSEDCIRKYHDVYAAPKKCSQCKKVLDDAQNLDILTWETMLFCNEDCLGKYQSFLGSHCTCCQTPVQQASLGKYCVCFGADIRQFCSGSCLEEFKKGLKVCSFCQTDLSAGTEGFLAPVGDKGQFKDFCSQRCMERYEMVNNIGSKSPPETQDCAFCKKQGVYRIQMKHNDKTIHLCCDLCVAGFRCAMQLKEDICDTCYNVFKLKQGEDFSFKLDGMHRHFCKKACMTLFVLSHRKIVPCVWCKVKKYNFDMIEKIDATNQSQMFCSLNCLSLYRVSLSATSAKSIRCDNCTKNLPAQYHLTMSDGSIRNFCTYQCVLHFQNQFTNVPALTTTSTTRQTSSTTTILKTTSSTSSPVISNVMSLASPRPSTPVTSIAVNKLVPQKLIPVRQQSPIVIASKSLGVSSTITSPSIVSTAAGPGGPQIIREVIVKPPAPKSVKNKTVSCKPIMQTKGISCKPHPCHKAVQTDESPRSIILPIPIPIYIPTPMHMFSRPVPCPVPFPVPIPIPIIVPTSKETPSQVIEHLKDIQEKTPSNPLEAEMLMMAELVAEDGSQNENESNPPNEAPPKKSEETASKTAVENSEVEVLEEPPSLEIVEENLSNDKEESEAEDEYVFKDAKSHRKRTTSSHGKKRKKCRISDAAVEESSFRPSTEIDNERNNAKENDKPEAPPPLLKPVIGVNAWKDWVLKKNSEMVKGSQSSRKFKLFKTDLLQLAPDELNFSLSLFVQEVRREDGDEYTPGSLFYLLLGIQRYLFDNGRIDNIFTDPYYEKFTECLNNILCRQDAVYALEAGGESFSSVELHSSSPSVMSTIAESDISNSSSLLSHSLMSTALEFSQPGIMPSPIHEEYLWEAKQLGAHSPHVLLNTLMYFNTKYFKLRKVEDHFRFSFTHVTKIKVRDFESRVAEEGRKVLRYYPPINRDYSRCSSSEIDVYEQVENSDALRCPVKLYEFYLSKCPESVKARNDIFYLYPERSCVPDSPVWYSTQPLGQEVIAKMIQRIKFVKGIYK